MGKKAQGKHKSYYERQRAVTSKHKVTQKAKRQKRLEMWIAKGVNKKGKPVLTLVQRKDRALVRRQQLEKRRADERKRIRQAEADWNAQSHHTDRKQRHNKRKFKPTEDE